MSLLRFGVDSDGNPDVAQGMTQAGAVPLPPLHRFYFAFVGLFALWVGLWGTFAPDQVDIALPWKVPPLHAGVIGAFYLSGLVLMVACMLRRRLDQTALGLRIAVVWTGMLLLASLLHIGTFEPANPRVWFWFFAYVLFPIWGAWLVWQSRSSGETSAGVPAAPWMIAYFLVQGVVCCALAALLFFMPSTMIGVWPWKISILLAQIYAGPFLSYGIASLLLTRRRHANEIETTAAAMATFVVLVLAASLIHRGLFPPGSVAVLIWFVALALAGGTLALVLVSRRRDPGGHA